MAEEPTHRMVDHEKSAEFREGLDTIAGIAPPEPSWPMEPPGESGGDADASLGPQVDMGPADYED